jgi:hypothetical protein
MTKQLTNLLLFIIPITVTYAIVSSIGTTGNYYGPPSPTGVSNSGLSQANGK